MTVAMMAKEVEKTLQEVINAHQFLYQPIVDPLVNYIPCPRLKERRFVLKKGKYHLKIDITPGGVMCLDSFVPGHIDIYFVGLGDDITNYKLQAAIQRFAEAATYFPPRKVVALLRFLDALARYLRKRGEGRIRALEELGRQQQRFIQEIEARSALRSL